VPLADAADYDAAFASLREAETHASTLEAVVRRLALTRPGAGEWERIYRALQNEAQCALRAVSRARSTPTARCEADFSNRERGGAHG